MSLGEEVLVCGIHTDLALRPSPTGTTSLLLIHALVSRAAAGLLATKADSHSRTIPDSNLAGISNPAM